MAMSLAYGPATSLRLVVHFVTGRFQSPAVSQAGKFTTGSFIRNHSPGCFILRFSVPDLSANSLLPVCCWRVV